MRTLAIVLLIIGGLNWGLVGLFNFDLIAAIFGGQDALISEIIYTLIGLAALYEIFDYSSWRRSRVVTTPSERTGRAA